MRKGADKFSCAVITMSDKGAVGEREDTSGAALQQILKDEGYSLDEYMIIPDVESRIVETLVDLVDNRSIDLIVTTGGTGVSPTDITPEAMRKVIDKEIPGMAEAMRAVSFAKTPNAVISRGICGIRKESLIVNLPGSKKAAIENIEVVLPAIPHALQKMKGEKSDCGG
ncbi:MogA/MoaB family molybdenum cofactor biosynthesis protein [Desulfopila inferna]|uniref:MogA/MoaB family molybdenum cofactor biosynthesis protein n=1 Tax=Desulfopila inferna TaxID=468528 RepID=UPI0019668A6F|nr:MogA/MoaB family molybdenum cofactor biosynthesis protein [Desulfopila inferna]MBM9602928.1 MogA/MoaB family molybdenum cofactor biosynthesis protein [Desulfopila inferna]